MTTTNAVLAEKLSDALYARKVNPRSVKFARSLMHGYKVYAGWTQAQRDCVIKVLAEAAA